MRRGELARPASMTDGSSSNWVLEEEATTVSLSPGLDGDGSGLVVAIHGKQRGSDWAEVKTVALSWGETKWSRFL
jgi:hypothetical protein